MMDKVYEKVKEGKIILELFQELDEVIGDEKGVTGIKIKSSQNGTTKVIGLQGVFIAIGHKPNTEIFAGQVDMKDGYLISL